MPQRRRASLRRSAGIWGSAVPLAFAGLVAVPAAAQPVPAAGAASGSTPSIPASVITASAAPGSSWRPEKPRYGVGVRKDVPVTMHDGTVLRADVYYPTDASGKQAKGRFPVVLTQTPYGKGLLGASSSSGTTSTGDQTGPDPYLVRRGYLDVVADVRGTGDSQGEFGLFDPIQDHDGVTLVRWASKLRGSSGKVGLYGASYLGINQLLTAGAEPRHSPLKAIFPVVPANDIYKDTSTMGGLIDVEFDTAYLSLTAGLNAIGPLVEGMQNPSVLLANLYPAEVQHLADLPGYDAPFAAETLSGGPTAYDGAYWQARNPVNALRRVVRNRIPAYLVGGEFDLFQRGEPLDYSGLQNAWAGRAVRAPMPAGQPVTGRYQLIDGPFTHLTGSTLDLDRLQLEWFDTWLKGERTGMAHTPTPLHYYDLGTGRFVETAHYPFVTRPATRFWFSSASSGSAPTSAQDHSLTLRRGTSATTDTLLWSPAGNPCGRPSDQWMMGASSLVAGFVSPQQPCVTDDHPGQLGLDRATYTTRPLAAARTIAGPIDVTIHAAATTTDTEWVAEIEDVAPDGTSTPLTEGALLGSLRAVERRWSWTDGHGRTILAAHPYTARSARPVTPGELTTYQIEVFPTYATIAKGHRIRVTLSTADTPHLAPTAAAEPNLVGGVYTVSTGGLHDSSLTMELLPAR